MAAPRLARRSVALVRKTVGVTRWIVLFFVVVGALFYGGSQLRFIYPVAVFREPVGYVVSLDLTKPTAQDWFQDQVLLPNSGLTLSHVSRAGYRGPISFILGPKHVLILKTSEISEELRNLFKVMGLKEGEEGPWTLLSSSPIELTSYTLHTRSRFLWPKRREQAIGVVTFLDTPHAASGSLYRLQNELRSTIPSRGVITGIPSELARLKPDMSVLSTAYLPVSVPVNPSGFFMNSRENSSSQWLLDISHLSSESFRETWLQFAHLTFSETLHVPQSQGSDRIERVTNTTPNISPDNVWTKRKQDRFLAGQQVGDGGWFTNDLTFFEARMRLDTSVGSHLFFRLTPSDSGSIPLFEVVPWVIEDETDGTRRTIRFLL